MLQSHEFTSRSTTKKGDYAEQIVRDWLIERGHEPHKPARGGPHSIDMFCMKADGRVYAIDAKAKAKRRLWDDTGIDYRHFNRYIDLERRADIDVWVFFVDHLEGWVYGATLAELRAPVVNPPGCKPGHYPRKEGEIVYFPRSSMHRLFPLKPGQVELLRTMTELDSRQRDIFAAI